MRRVECLRDKLDLIFWWLIWVLPFVGAVLVVATSGTHDFSAFLSFMQGFAFPFITDIWLDIEATIGINFPEVLRVYASYLVSVEIVHVFVDVMIFIPRICHKIVEVDNYIDIGFGRKR